MAATPASTRAANTFPYKPSGGFTPEEIWGEPSPALIGPPGSEPSEVRNRIRKVGEDILSRSANILLDELEQRVRRADPQGKLEAARELDRTRREDRTAESLPVIRVQGRGAQISTAGIVVMSILGGLLIIGILKDRKQALG